MHLRHRIDGAIAIITLTNPPQNRITPQMNAQLCAAISDIGSSPARAVLVHAEGPDFSLGGDIRNWPGLDAAAMRDMLAEHLAAFNAFESLSIPTLCAVQGLCFGGGLELALRADIVVSGETARFGHPEQSIGVATLLGGIYRVAAKAGRAKAMEWALTSEQVPAHEMERHGVINKVVPDTQLLEEALAFTHRIAVGPTRAHAAHKALLNAWTAGGLLAADDVLLDLCMPLFDTSDAKTAIPAAVKALQSGKPRPSFAFEGR